MSGRMMQCMKRVADRALYIVGRDYQLPVTSSIFFLRSTPCERCRWILRLFSKEKERWSRTDLSDASLIFGSDWLAKADPFRGPAQSAAAQPPASATSLTQLTSKPQPPLPDRMRHSPRGHVEGRDARSSGNHRANQRFAACELRIAFFCKKR